MRELPDSGEQHRRGLRESEWKAEVPRLHVQVGGGSGGVLEGELEMARPEGEVTRFAGDEHC